MTTNKIIDKMEGHAEITYDKVQAALRTLLDSNLAKSLPSPLCSIVQSFHDQICIEHQGINQPPPCSPDEVCTTSTPKHLIDSKTLYQREYQRNYRRKRMQEPEYKQKAYNNTLKWRTKVREEKYKSGNKKEKNLDILLNERDTIQHGSTQTRIQRLSQAIYPDLPKLSQSVSAEEVARKVTEVLYTSVNNVNVVDFMTTRNGLKRSIDTVIKAAIYREEKQFSGDEQYYLKTPAITRTVLAAINEMDLFLGTLNH